MLVGEKMANGKELSLVRGKDSIPGESVNVDLAQRPVNVVPLFRKK
jgi:hypothetical protein